MISWWATYAIRMLSGGHVRRWTQHAQESRTARRSIWCRSTCAQRLRHWERSRAPISTTSCWIASSAISASGSKMQKFAVTFRKGDDARFLSHLDLTALLEYAVRRAGLPVSLSEGFSPRPRLSVAASLALGYVGEAELFELTLREPLAALDVGKRLAAVLPAGIEVVSVKGIEPGAKSAASRLQSALYRIDLPSPIDDLQQR